LCTYARYEAFQCRCSVLLYVGVDSRVARIYLKWQPQVQMKVLRTQSFCIACFYRKVPCTQARFCFWLSTGCHQLYTCTLPLCTRGWGCRFPVGLSEPRFEHQSTFQWQCYPCDRCGSNTLRRPIQSTASCWMDPK